MRRRTELLAIVAIVLLIALGFVAERERRAREDLKMRLDVLYGTAFDPARVFYKLERKLRRDY